MNSPKLSYRAEIDGLRAIAVVSVILYHAQIVVLGRDWFKGGFLGVDIFFVISGYLITRIILSELQTKGSFSFLNFYERRARRILPMLFVVIFVSIPFAWQNLLPSDFVEYAESILASLFFGSNIFFYFSTTEYGADSALLKPFLHTWSLGVEEQFYFVFPIIAIITFKFFRQHFLTILVGLSLLSIQFAELMEVRNSDLNFYLPFSRFWELAAGSMLAYRELNHKASNEGIRTKILPMLGLYLIAYSILFFGSNTPHPSFRTLIPIIGTALIIGFASKDELVGKVLGSKPFVWIGLVSYSAYLWHFPIFAFARHSSLSYSNYDKFEWIAATFFLSTLSLYLIEAPLRNSTRISKSAFLILIGITSSILVSVSFLIAKGHIVNPKTVLVEKLIDNGAMRNEHREFEVGYDYSIKRNGRMNLLIVGNSHAEDLLKALSFSYLANEVNLNLVSPSKREYDINYQVTCFNQFLINGTTKCFGSEKKGGEVVEYAPNIGQQYASSDVILLATSWLDSSEGHINAIASIVASVLRDGKKIIVVSNTPQSNTFGEKRLNRFDKFLFENKNTLPTRSELYALEREFFFDNENGRVKEVNDKLKKIVESFSDDNVVFKERSDFMCNKNEKRCFMYFPQDKAKVLWDYGHTTTDGARVLGRLITEKQWLSDILR